jgi:histidinol-phosphate aminotransferase
MTFYFRPSVDAMTGYIPGEQPKPGTNIIKLNTNENPYPPSPDAIAVLRNLDSEWLRRYPDPYANEFRKAISEVLQVPVDWILVSNGSDDLLNLVVRACAERERKVVYPMPTYVLYRTLTDMQPAERIEIPYGEDYSLPFEELVAAKGAVTLIASPNSPSGHVVPLEDLRQLAARLSGVLVVDEAYVDFAETTALPLGIAHPQLLSGLFKVKDSYNIDAIACLVGAAAMRDQAYKNECIQKVKASRIKLAADLKSLGFRLWDSQGNFFLTQPPQGNAEQLYLALKEQGILVRYFQQPGLADKLRITVGTDEQNQKLVEKLRDLV